MKRLYRVENIQHQAPGEFKRAHLEIYGIDHFRPSYLSLIFFNDTDVTCDNASPERESFAGSFTVFGHSTCYGDEGHCSSKEELRRFDLRRSHPLTKAIKRVNVTEALRREIKNNSKIDITIVAITYDEEDTTEARNSLFDCEGIQLVTFQ